MTDGRSAALLARFWRQHRSMLAIIAAGLALFEFVITRVAPAPGDAGFLAGLVALLPAQISAFIGGELALGSPGGVIAFGYLHPFFIALLSAWVIRVSASALAGEIGRGTMDLLAARPIPRVAHVLAAWVWTATGLAILLGAAWIGTAIGLQLRSLGVAPWEVIRLPAMAWLLFTSWTSIAILVSATQDEAGPAIAWSSGLIALSFVVEFLAQVWEPAAWTRPLSLFSYYRPTNIMRSGIVPADPLALCGVVVAGLVAALLIFRRRDL